MNKYNQILVHLLEKAKNWAELKPQLEKYNTPQSLVTKKSSIAGKIFEFFAYYHYKSEPSKTEIYEKVWMYDDIPLEIKEKLKLPEVDHGIDILLQDYDKKYHAVQCKFKNNENVKLSWSGDKIANVFALGTNCDKIIVYTNAAEITSVAKAFENKFELVDFNDLYSIDNEIFINIFKLAKGQAPKQLDLYDPLDHQKDAIKDVLKHFSNNDRGQLILPCGAGKTLTALWIKERIKAKKTLVLVPSLALLKQIKNDWAKQKRESYRYICVCSEKDIDKDKSDYLNIHTYEIGGPVTTNSNDVQEFISRNQDIVVFSTYQSSLVISEASKKIENFKFDLVICDEAHRTAGSKGKNTFTIVHNDELLKASKRLYMTATPKVVSKRLKARLAEDYELLCDMSNPEIFGEEAYRMSFGNAIKEGILVDYKIIGIGVTDRQIKEFIDERSLIGKISIDEIAHNYALDLVMNKYSAFHALSFHSRVQYAENFSNKHKELFPNVFSSSVNGKQRTTKRTKTLRDFKNSKMGLVSNARCLTEGIDVPTIDMIYFCDPKSSKIDIVQASGRALRTDKTGKKQTGYIVVPIFHHIEDDVEIEIKRKPIFNHLIQVIRSLCDQDERLQAEINDIAFKKGKKAHSKRKLDFTDAQTEKVVKLFGMEKIIKNALFDEIIEKTRNNWEVMFKQLVEYIKDNGNANVPARYNNDGLGNWVVQQRVRKNNNTLEKVKEELLNEVGFNWEPKRWIFDQFCQQLIKFRLKYGHKEVPIYCKDFPKLGYWNSKFLNLLNNGLPQSDGSLRYGSTYLFQNEIKILKDLGFVQNLKTRGWSKSYEKLYDFYIAKGYSNPTQKENQSLYDWCLKIRTKIIQINEEQKELLKEINFNFEINSSRRKTRDSKVWSHKLEEVKQHIDNNTECNPKLKSWIRSQRFLYQKNRLSNDRIVKLKDIGIQLTGKDNLEHNKQVWNTRYNELFKFYQKNTHTIYKKKYENKTLYNWILTQRSYRKKGLLTEDRIKLLDNIKFNWESISQGKKFKPNKDQWLEMYNQLKSYKVKFGNTNVSQLTPEYKSLGRWVNSQRVLKKGKIDKRKIYYLQKDRELLLDRIGFIWDRLDYRFNLKLVSLIKYKNKNGHFNIKPSDEGYKSLYYWLNKLKKYGIEEKRVKQLQEIGFDTSDFPVKEEKN
ncbi:MAG: Helicase associated domain protein [Candidatus Delongbacteria bacterium]|nr:Helicase associated domain protein [Candidatus Delongbacteria bacterium]